ncbi:MAG: hypothetical protein Q9217_005424 [Psora testacea]
MEHLLRYGNDINKPDEEGYSPLHRAACWSSLKPARLLLDMGANLEVLGSITPLLDACRVKCESVVDLLAKRGASFAPIQETGLGAFHCTLDPTCGREASKALFGLVFAKYYVIVDPRRAPLERRLACVTLTMAVDTATVFLDSTHAWFYRGTSLPPYARIIHGKALSFSQTIKNDSNNSRPEPYNCAITLPVIHE